MIMKSITAVVPVKKTSSRLPDKNILPFAESNLLLYKIRQLKRVSRINEILVSSDSDEMLAMAEKEGVRCIKRPQQYADESRPFSDFIEYITNIVDSDMILWACVTSPLVDETLYDKAINIMDSVGHGYDSLITVYPFKHFLMDANGTVNFYRGEKHVNSQDLPEMYIFTNGIILAEVQKMRKWRYHFGPNPYYLKVTREQSIDIDEYYDYKMAQLIYDEMNKKRD